MPFTTRAHAPAPNAPTTRRWSRGGVTVTVAGIGLSLAALAAAPANAATHTAASKSATVEVKVKTVAKYGKILVNQKGFALYYDSKNTPGHWACTKGCLSAWPPLLLPKGHKAAKAGAGVKGLGTVKAPYGTQVTWDGKALYTFVEDSAGKVTGNDVHNFFVVVVAKAAGASGPTTTTTISPMTTTTVQQVTTTTGSPMTTTTVPPVTTTTGSLTTTTTVTMGY